MTDQQPPRPVEPQSGGPQSGNLQSGDPQSGDPRSGDPRAALARARLYLCTDSRARQGDLADFLDAVLSNGVDVVQLREKGLEARAELRLLEVFADAAARHGALWAVNDRADVALASGAPILHLGQDDLPVPQARRIVGDEVLIGRSTHDPAQADAARGEPGVDYYCTGPTWTTPTKPGRPAAGLSLLDHATAHQDRRPWFAIGGIENLARLDEVIARGARRVVVVRMLTEAQDPGAAARAAADRLAKAGDLSGGAGRGLLGAARARRAARRRRSAPAVTIRARGDDSRPPSRATTTIRARSDDSRPR